MQNDPTLNGKYLGTITKDFVVVADTLKEAAYQLKTRKISEYPIFIFTKQYVEIGQTLLQGKEVAISWDINFSFLEEFEQRQIIGADKINEFKQAYKDIDEFCCLFVIDGDFVNFMYIPYPEDGEKDASV